MTSQPGPEDRDAEDRDAVDRDAEDRDAEDRDAEAVDRANEAFYEAFEARDFDAMSDVWEHSSRVVCTHPGWATLHGWGAVSGAWFALLQNAQRLQFIVTNAQAHVVGDVGWATCDENVLDAEESSTVAATNVFVRAEGSRHGWRMVAHHGSLVHASIGPNR